MISTYWYLKFASRQVVLKNKTETIQRSIITRVTENYNSLCFQRSMCLKDPLLQTIAVDMLLATANTVN